MTNTKYYGMIYHGTDFVYDFKAESIASHTPYAALKQVNEKWNNQNHHHEGRLLVVAEIKANPSSPSTKTFAFFQFTSSKTCEKFVLQEKEIIWSPEKCQIWNGDAVFMNPTQT